MANKDYRFLNFLDFSIFNIPLQELKDKYCNADSKFMTIDGMEVHYKDQGEGPVILMMHGVVASLHTWDAWYDLLKDNFRIIRLDMPGFGITGPRENGDYMADTTNKFLDGFLDNLNVENLFIAGNSLGGFYGWNYTAYRPERVDALLALDTVAYKQSTPYAFILAKWLPFSTLWVKYISFPRFFMEDSLRLLYADPERLLKDVNDRYWELSLREGNRGTIMDIFSTIYDMFREPEIAAKVKDVKRPTLMVWGKEDEWSRWEETIDFWKRDLPHAEFKFYEDCGHMPMEEKPEPSAYDAFKFFAQPIADRPHLEKYNLPEKFKKYEEGYLAKNK